MEPELRSRRAQRLAALFDRAPMKHTFNMALSFDADGRARFEMPHQREFEHGLKDFLLILLAIVQIQDICLSLYDRAFQSLSVDKSGIVFSFL